MPTGTSCMVYIDDQLLADGSTEDEPGTPTALSGLSFTWGRDTTVDQPGAAACSFVITDPVGGATFLDTIGVGSTVRVKAVAGFYDLDPDTPVWPDPGFETGQSHYLAATNCTVAVTDTEAATGDHSVKITASSTAVVWAYIYPMPQRQIEFTEDAATWNKWVSIPYMGPEKGWRMRVKVLAPAGRAFTLTAIETGGDSLRVGLNFTGTGEWQTCTSPASWSAFPNSGFPCLRVNFTPAAAGEILYVDDVEFLPPAGALSGYATDIYAGRVTSLEASWDSDSPIVKVNTVDFTGDLENVRVGDEPWYVETLSSRFWRILSLALNDWSDHPVVIDDSVASTLVSYRDVDSQGAMGLLTELAASVDGILWATATADSLVAFDDGNYGFHLEDPRNRPARSVLIEQDGVVVIGLAPGQTGDVQLSSCDVLRDEVTWIQDTQDITTRAAVTWLEEGTDDEGATTTTERTYTSVDTDLETLIGQRGLSLSSQLQAETDAAGVAGRLLARLSAGGWRATGLTIDDTTLDDGDHTITGILLTLLSMRWRPSLAIDLVDMPEWTPGGQSIPVYLEGGTYTFKDGFWDLSLVVSNAAGQGASAHWDELDPTWTWNDFDPAITWNDLRGVAVADQGA